MLTTCFVTRFLQTHFDLFTHIHCHSHFITPTTASSITGQLLSYYGEIKKQKKTKTIATADSAGSKELKDILFEFEGHISKLEKQLWEKEAQKQIEVAAALEMGRKEGYIHGYEESRLELAKAAPGADCPWENDTLVGHIASQPHNISALYSGSRNPWGSLTRCYCCSHPPNWPVCYCCHSWHVTEDYGHATVPLPAPAQSVETIYHLYRIGPAKPITITSISEPFTNPTKHLMHPMFCKSLIIQTRHRQLLPISSHIPFTQSHHVLPSHYSLFSFIPVFLSYSLSLPSWFFAVLLFGR